MRFSEAAGRKVVSTSTAGTVGQIDGFVVDPQTHSLVALTVKKSRHGDTLLWSSVTAFGVDAVTVQAADAITKCNDAVAALSGKDRRMIGKRVLNTGGEDLGAVTDADFDPATGRLTTLRLESGDIDGERLVAIGSYAAVVHRDA